MSLRPWHRTLAMSSAVAVALITLWLYADGRLSHSLADTPAPPPAPAADSAPTPRQLIGLDRVEGRLGHAAPTGKDIIFGHVEGSGEEYMPDIRTDRFRGVNFVAASGPGTPNGHSNATALMIFGKRGMAPGVEEVVCFNTLHWLTTYLRVGTGKPPAGGRIRVFTNSWIMPIVGQGAAEILARTDYVIDHNNVIIVAGVDNGHDKPVPAVLASAYNTISVGTWTGDSSGGYTQGEGAGRCKPEIVAPMTLTSFATPIVAACAARLLETADHMPPDSNAGRPEVIKAVLLAGADKPPHWTQADGKPLDSHFGAGRLRFDHSYDMLATGPEPPGVIHNRYGWDYRALPRGEQHVYRFEVPAGLGEASLILTWNRRIDGRLIKNPANDQTVWGVRPGLADFDLRLVKLNDAGEPSEAGISANDIDNVEHIYLKQLPPGRYRIEVTRKDKIEEDWTYALAWRIEGSPTTQPAE